MFIEMFPKLCRELEQKQEGKKQGLLSANMLEAFLQSADRIRESLGMSESESHLEISGLSLRARTFSNVYAYYDSNAVNVYDGPYSEVAGSVPRNSSPFFVIQRHSGKTNSIEKGGRDDFGGARYTCHFSANLLGRFVDSCPRFVDWGSSSTSVDGKRLRIELRIPLDGLLVELRRKITEKNS